MGFGTPQELKTRMTSLLDENERIQSAITIEDNGGVVVSKDDAAHYRKNLAEAQEIRKVLSDIEATAELKAFASQTPQSAAAAAAAGAAATPAQYQTQVKSLGELFTGSDEFKALITSGGANMSAPWEIEGTDVTRVFRGYGQKDVYAGSGDHTYDHGFGNIQFDPMVPRNFRRARVRDLFPVAQTNANLIDFFRVIGFGSDRLDLSSSASMVPDRNEGDTNFGLKPQSSLTFESDQAPVRTIAHYELAHRNVLQDEPQLQSTINNELLYGLRLTEDNQILNGTGTGEDLRGILNTSGVQTYSQSAGPSTDGKQDALRRAATKAVLAYFDPTGIVCHPYDWEDIELAKGADEHYTVSMNVTIGAEARLWRMNVVDSPAIAQGTALVGAFGLGAQLYDRMQANIRIAEQHSDLFVRNAVAILAEQRLALAVKRPESFVKVTLS